MLLDAGRSGQDLLTIGKIAVWMMKKREKHVPAMPLMWGKEWARDPTVLQPCTGSPPSSYDKATLNQPSFTAYYPSAAALL